ncbi:MAG: hypothetical protein IJL70_03300 [Treponema sp.]|nr:hypothetical protein [Treponema sp.]
MYYSCMTFKDLQVIKKCLSDRLVNFEGPISEKQKIDNAYLAVVDILNGVRIECSADKLEFSDIQDVELGIDYNLDSVIAERMNRDNLTLDF